MVTRGVVEWRWCEAGLLPYRREPFLHERAWVHRGRWLDAAPEPASLGDPWDVRRVGLDADGRVLVVGPAGLPLDDWTEQRVVAVRWDGDRSTAFVAGELELHYLTDGAGRVVAREGDGGGERYDRDDDGRVVGIHESDELVDELNTAAWSNRDVGGRLTVCYEDGSAVEIGDEGGRTVWAELTAPYADVRARVVATWTELVRRALTEAVPADRRDEAVGALHLTYVDQGPVWVAQAAVAFAELAPAGWEALYAPSDDAGVTEEVDLEAWDAATEGIEMLQHEALHVQGDPYRTLLGKLARGLVAAPPTGLRLAPSSVVLFAEHDEGIAEKVAVVREINPRERAEAFLAPILATTASHELENSLPGFLSPESTTWGAWP